MSYLRYTREHEQERSPYADSDPYYLRPLVRCNSKRQRVDLHSDDDEYDDYPYASKHLPFVQPVKPSRALTIRQPSQLEKYNVWSHTPTHDHEHTRSRAHDGYDDAHDGHYKYAATSTSHKHYIPRPLSRTLLSDDEDSDANRHEREFRLKVRASFGRPKGSLSRSNSYAANTYSQAQKAMAWSGDLFKRKERWEDTAWESRGRTRGAETRGFWEDEPRAAEKEVRFRRIKRTKTDEWKPLSGFRRA